MTSSPKPNRPGFVVALGGLGLIYPFAVYLSLGRVPAGALAAVALALMAGRLLFLRRSSAARALVPALVMVMSATAAVAVVDAQAAALAYPVLMSAGMAAAFGLSLWRPPSLVECLAALTEPSPGAAARAYMRTVSAVWCGFLTVNAGVSAATAMLGDLGLWALYNGFVSYVLMGLLFGAELLVRRRVRRRETGA